MALKYGFNYTNFSVKKRQFPGHDKHQIQFEFSMHASKLDETNYPGIQFNHSDLKIAFVEVEALFKAHADVMKVEPEVII